MLSNTSNQEKSIWEKFIQGEPIDTSKVKPEVLDSWQRCKGKVNPRKGKNYDIWSAKDFERIKLKYRDLLGSELFGYVEGAFTGAKKGGSPGKFELSDGGTIFLDEIGEMPLDMQTSLLRVLEEKAVTRVGDKGAIPVDVRVVAATNRDLEKEVEKGNFRADLYYRINVVSIELPPLRDRTGDISLLISHFVKKMSERMEKKIDIISSDVYRNCALYDWPGNVRELQNIIDRAVTLVEGNTISSHLFPERLAKLSDDFPHTPEARKLRDFRKTLEHDAIQACIETCGGNMTRVAKELGISALHFIANIRILVRIHCELVQLKLNIEFAVSHYVNFYDSARFKELSVIKL